MNPELLSALSESESLARQLLTLLQQDRDDIRRCLKADLVDDYQKGADKAISIVSELIRQLDCLHSEQMLTM